MMRENYKHLESPRWLVKKSTLEALLVVLLFRICLDLLYYFIISRVWNYMHFEWQPNIIKLVESYCLLFIIYIALPKSQKKLSTIILWLLILFSYVPMLTIFALMDQSRTFMYAATAFWLLVFLILRQFLPNFSLPPLKQAKIIGFLILILFNITALAILYKYFGLLINKSILTAYNLRSQFVEGADNWAARNQIWAVVYGIRSQFIEKSNFLINYLFTWLAFIINPTIFALFIIKKKWRSVLMVVVIQFLLFFATGYKTFIFILPLVLILMWLISRPNCFVYIVMMLLGIMMFDLLISQGIVGETFFVRRGLLVSAQTSFFTYDFFSRNQHIFLTHHRIFQAFGEYPYELKPPNIIGQEYFGHPDWNIAIGIIPDAYMNFGFMGLILWAILLAFILKVVDACAKNKDIRVGIAAMVIYATISLKEGALLTNLSSMGMLFAILVLYLLPRKKHEPI